MNAQQQEYDQEPLFELPEITAGFFSVKTGKPQQLPEGEEFTLHYGQVVSGRFVGEVSGIVVRDGRLTWEVSATEVALDGR